MAMTTRSARHGIGALSKRTGCNIETIRYYERIGLMPHPARTDGGHRLYGEDLVKRLGFVRRSRELGFTLDQIRTLLGLVDGRRYTCAEVKRITVEHLGEIRRKVADLGKIERVLADMAVQCDANTVPLCPVIDALFDETRGSVPAAARTRPTHSPASARRGASMARRPRRTWTV